MRMFIGVPLGEAVRSELLRLTERLRRGEDRLRWSAPAGWHITLQFLGSTRPDQFVCVRERLAAIAAARFPVDLEAPGVFDRAGVFFAGVKVSPRLQRLQQAVTAATAPCGFVAEDRPYHPHITLARSKDGRGALKSLEKRLPPDVRFSSFVAGRFVLYESFPGPGGSRYEERASFPLH